MRRATSQPNELLDETTDLGSIGDNENGVLDLQNMNMFFDHDITRYDSSDASMGQDLAFSVHEMDFLTPCSSHSTGVIFNSSDTSMTSISIENEGAADFARSANNSGSGVQSPRSSMECLAKIGLDLHEQTTKYQRCGDNVTLQDLVSDVLRSSTDYLDCLLSLDETFASSQSSTGFGNAWTDGQSYQTTTAPQLDMSAAFQLLIPYVRLVQLHNILYRSMLRYLSISGNDVGYGSGSGSGNGPSDAPSPRSNIPTLTVDGACINASGPFRARLLLHVNLDLLAEIETALELPQEARLCCPQAESGMGINSDMGLVANAQGTCGGLLHKAVSPRLLRTILEERNLGMDGIQSMRDCITRIKSLLRSTARHRSL